MLRCSEADHFDKVLARALMMLSTIHNSNIKKQYLSSVKKYPKYIVELITMSDLNEYAS